jgi:hypothetical protein
VELKRSRGTKYMNPKDIKEKTFAAASVIHFSLNSFRITWQKGSSTNGQTTNFCFHDEQMKW